MEGTGCYEAAQVQRALRHCRGNVDEVGSSDLVQAECGQHAVRLHSQLFGAEGHDSQKSMLRT